MYLQIWNSNKIKDEFMGQHELAATEDCTSKVLELDLFNRKKGADRQKLPGKLYVEVTTTRRMEDH